MTFPIPLLPILHPQPRGQCLAPNRHPTSHCFWMETYHLPKWHLPISYTTWNAIRFPTREQDLACRVLCSIYRRPGFHKSNQWIRTQNSGYFLTSSPHLTHAHAPERSIHLGDTASAHRSIRAPATENFCKDFSNEQSWVHDTACSFIHLLNYPLHCVTHPYNS